MGCENYSLIIIFNRNNKTARSPRSDIQTSGGSTDYESPESPAAVIAGGQPSPQPFVSENDVFSPPATSPDDDYHHENDEHYNDIAQKLQNLLIAASSSINVSHSSANSPQPAAMQIDDPKKAIEEILLIVRKLKHDLFFLATYEAYKIKDLVEFSEFQLLDDCRDLLKTFHELFPTNTFDNNLLEAGRLEWSENEVFLNIANGVIGYFNASTIGKLLIFCTYTMETMVTQTRGRECNKDGSAMLQDYGYLKDPCAGNKHYVSLECVLTCAEQYLLKKLRFNDVRLAQRRGQNTTGNRRKREGNNGPNGNNNSNGGDGSSGNGGGGDTGGGGDNGNDSDNNHGGSGGGVRRNANYKLTRREGETSFQPEMDNLDFDLKSSRSHYFLLMTLSSTGHFTTDQHILSFLFSIRTVPPS